MIISQFDNTCIVCGAVIPESYQVCPICGATEADMFEQSQPEFKVDDTVEQSFREGYTKGFEEGTKHACIIKQDNERLKRENAMLRSQIESRLRTDDIDAEYE